jgi:hypothetical protein
MIVVAVRAMNMRVIAAAAAVLALARHDLTSSWLSRMDVISLLYQVSNN